MHDDVGVAADGRGEVSVERHIQGVVVKEGLVLQDASAEVESHLKGGRNEGRCEQGWCHEAGGVWLCGHSASSQWPFDDVLSAGGPSPAAQFELCRDEAGTAETEHRTKGSSGCQLSLLGPKDCINFNITHGSKQLPLSAQALGLICHPPIFQGRAQLVLCPTDMFFHQEASQSGSHAGSLVLGLAAGFTHPLCMPGEHWGLGLVASKEEERAFL